MHKTLLVSFLFIGSFFSSYAQQIVSAYIDTALKNNLVIKQKIVSLEQAQNSLKEAKSYFLPSVSFQAGYQTADGGRDIALPLGDLLNPVYSTLNQLTSSNKFPTLKNQSIDFLPKNFHDAKVRTVVPLIDPSISFQNKIAKQQVGLTELELKIYKRDLIRDVKIAYYNYLSSSSVVSVYQSAQLLAKEALRVNRRLLDNGKGLPAYVLRSESELSTANSQLYAAEQQQKNAQLYFNFLLNRDAEETINIETATIKWENLADLLNDGQVNEQLEEIKAMRLLTDIRKNVVQLDRRYAVPRLSAFLDLGTQSEGFKFNANTRYYLFGLQLDIPLFAGNRNRYKLKESELQLKNATNNLTFMDQQKHLKASVSKNELRIAWEQYQASLKQSEAANTYFRLVDKGFLTGTNSFIETIEARNHLVAAQIGVQLNKYKVFTAIANVERETANYSL